MPELAPILKQLRLSGIVESPEQRTRQAIENKLTLPEFLALIIRSFRTRPAGEIRKSMSLACAGPSGTGKSHLAQAIGHCAVRRGTDVLFMTQTQRLLAQLHAAKATGGYERKMQMLTRVPLLVIDDFGLKPLKLGQDEGLHDLVSERYERGATIVTSNLDFVEWGEALPNKLLRAATLDRLRHSAYQVVLHGKSYRAPRVPLTAAKTASGQAGLDAK